MRPERKVRDSTLLRRTALRGGFLGFVTFLAAVRVLRRAKRRVKSKAGRGRAMAGVVNGLVWYIENYDVCWKRVSQ